VNTPTLEVLTRLACLTPSGVGAIATLAVRGPRAWSVVCELFQPASGRPLPADAEAGRFWLGRFGEEGGTDEVVLAVRRSGPMPWLELHCHGGLEVVRFLEELIAARGVARCSWQELESETGESSWRAEALAALARAPTARTAAILLGQYQGALVLAARRALRALRDGDLEKARELLGALAAYGALGRHLTEPWRVVIAGAPNVGKSSLVNALAGFQRSVVAQTPGTTRDVVTARIAVDGWPVELADTAGWREDADPLERQGIDLAWTAATRADLCLWVLDGSRQPVWPDREIKSVHCVINKTDLPSVWDFDRAGEAICVSAHTGEGLGELCRSLAAWLVPEAPRSGVGVPFTPGLCAAVQSALRACALGEVREASRVLEAVCADRR